jgi:hypothetical protein
VASSGVGWIRCAEAQRVRLASGSSNVRRLAAFAAVAAALAPLPGLSPTLPVLHITQLGMHADKRVVKPGESFHVTIHVHIREKRDRLDELVLPALTNAVDLGDERRRSPAPDGTDFYETLTVAASTVGTASFTPAYIDAIDPATGRGMRYSSAPLSVRVADGTTIDDADPHALASLLRTAALVVVGLFVLLVIGIVLLVRRVRRPRTKMPPPSPQPPPTVRVVSATKADPVREALGNYRARGTDESLDVLRNVLFMRAGAAPGATFADALRALGSRDSALGRALAVAERARFGPVHERATAARDLLTMLDAYVQTGDYRP